MVPMDGCDEYDVELRWKVGRNPAVWVSGGAVERCDDLNEIPHQFGCDEDRRRVNVCLQRGDWDESMLIAESYVPWTLEWLSRRSSALAVARLAAPSAPWRESRSLLPTA